MSDLLPAGTGRPARSCPGSLCGRGGWLGGARPPAGDQRAAGFVIDVDGRVGVVALPRVGERDLHAVAPLSVHSTVSRYRGAPLSGSGIGVGPRKSRLPA